jgi:hypothetical protein
MRAKKSVHLEKRRKDRQEEKEKKTQYAKKNQRENKVWSSTYSISDAGETDQ